MSQFDFGAIGYGCMYLTSDERSESDRLIRTALDHGMRLIDTADIYGYGTDAGFGAAEERLGEILSADPSLRDRMILATKGGITPPRPYDSSRDYLMSALETSLQRLRVETIDLYQIHRPDLMIPMSDLAETLQIMIDSGKVQAIGVSNFTAGQMRALSAHLKTPLRTIQPEFSVLNQSALTDGVLDYSEEISADVLAWSPLASGRIFTENGPVQATLARIAADTGRT
ncbi:MAG: aldo/keto reductase, partial [Pseudomonadota bacterium]